MSNINKSGKFRRVLDCFETTEFLDLELVVFRSGEFDVRDVAVPVLVLVAEDLLDQLVLKKNRLS